MNRRDFLMALGTIPMLGVVPAIKVDMQSKREWKHIDKSGTVRLPIGSDGQTLYWNGNDLEWIDREYLRPMF